MQNDEVASLRIPIHDPLNDIFDGFFRDDGLCQKK